MKFNCLVNKAGLKLKFKWIKDLYINSTILKHIEEKVGSTLECIGTDNLNIVPAPQTLRETINKWNDLKMKRLCKAKDMINKTK